MRGQPGVQKETKEIQMKNINSHSVEAKIDFENCI